MTIREIVPDDAHWVTEIHCADEAAWWAHRRGGAPCPYADLTAEERWLHGGPWMDRGLCAAYLGRLRGAGHRTLGALRGGIVADEVPRTNPAAVSAPPARPKGLPSLY